MPQPEYRYTADTLTAEKWTEILVQFRDACLYQSWSYGAVRWGANNLAHLILWKGDQVAAAAQIRIMCFPLVGGIAYVTWGPLWKRKGQPDNPEVLCEMFRALRKEFAERRKFFLRVLPSDEDTDSESLVARIAQRGFTWSKTSYQTIVMDLTLSPDELRKSMRNTWRQTLQKAERAGVEVEEGTSVELFRECLEVYDQMHGRKGFAAGVDMSEYAGIQADLPDSLKMRISVCRLEGKVVAALAWSVIGETGIPMLAATGDQALKMNALHYLYWNMIQRMKDQGCTAMNMGGINKEENKGGYVWKSGLSGKRGREVGQIGQFDACDSFVSGFAVRWGDRLRAWREEAKRKAARARQAASAASVVSAQKDAPPPSKEDAPAKRDSDAQQ
jgi:lipid II:glycine glycyltransferase (peptidoglycan interpeptide bridge formation enzyme)